MVIIPQASQAPMVYLSAITVGMIMGISVRHAFSGNCKVSNLCTRIL